MNRSRLSNMERGGILKPTEEELQRLRAALDELASQVDHRSSRGLCRVAYPNQKEYARTAIQSLSLTVAEQRIYTHTGWREIHGGWAFLHAGGAIAASGGVSETNGNFRCTQNRYHLPSPPKPYDGNQTRAWKQPSGFWNWRLHPSAFRCWRPPSEPSLGTPTFRCTWPALLARSRARWLHSISNSSVPA